MPLKDETTVEIEFEMIVHETDAAYLLEVPTFGEKTADVWIPKSQVAQIDREAKTMEVTEWVAVEKGLA